MIGVITEIASSSGVGKCMALRSWWERMKGQSQGMLVGTQENGHVSL